MRFDKCLLFSTVGFNEWDINLDVCIQVFNKQIACAELMVSVYLSAMNTELLKTHISQLRLL